MAKVTAKDVLDWIDHEIRQSEIGLDDARTTMPTGVDGLEQRLAILRELRRRFDAYDPLIGLLMRISKQTEDAVFSDAFELLADLGELGCKAEKTHG